MDRLRSILPALALCLLPLAHADTRQPQPCDDVLLDSLASQLGQQGWTLPSGRSDGPLVAAACKPWPDDPKLSVVTLAYRDAEDATPVGERNLNWLVAKVDTQSGQLRERYDDYLGEDAALEIDAGSLWLDTARYHLAPGVRAFGVVMRSVARGASCPDAGFNNLLTLVVPDGSGLRPVFSTYLYGWTTIKGTSCVMDREFESEQADLTLGLGPKQTHGYADLVVTAQVRAGRQEPVQRKVSTTVRYDGKHYPFDQFPMFWMREPQP
ncbi:hypothetical protein [Ectopseudomonas alcaliphila]|uniref:hypothetical protein n=1 Tax=Ectopseudomonas alcaliphila TaxID=101564 RepID=UPI002787BBD6|nr:MULTISPECIES: hypothetical protein [Pseudomonas]MDP9941016.1 hypothetical protein [Pseudomonas sp. 3400]MDR7013235.1 hypothetical protein [Pseudomonas alcaliphila]